MRLAMAIELHALKHGYRVLSFYHQGQMANEVRDIYELKGMRVEGLIAYPVERIEGESYRQLAQSGFPMVLLGVDTQALGFEVSTVNMDFADSSLRAVAHLTALGRHRLAFMAGGTASWSVQARLKGWREGCALAGLHFEACPMASDTMDSAPEAGYRMARAMLTKNKSFDAFLVSNDMMAIAAIKALHDARLRVPEDVAFSLNSFDNLQPANTGDQYPGDSNIDGSVGRPACLANISPRGRAIG